MSAATPGPPPGRIVVDFDPETDPIAGRVYSDGRAPRTFTGWTGLFAALRAATENSASRDGAGGVTPAFQEERKR